MWRTEGYVWYFTFHGGIYNSLLILKKQSTLSFQHFHLNHLSSSVLILENLSCIGWKHLLYFFNSHSKLLSVRLLSCGKRLWTRWHLISWSFNILPMCRNTWHSSQNSQIDDFKKSLYCPNLQMTHHLYKIGLIPL